MLKKFLLAPAVLAGLLYAAPASADNFIFDLDGPGALGSVTAASLDWNVGNAIAQGLTASSQVGSTFQLFFQANLSLANIAGGGVVNNNSGVGAAQDSLTLVVGFSETLTANTITPASILAGAPKGLLSFDFDPGGVNIFRIYANDVPGVDLTGVCFVCGTLVMQGTIVPAGFSSNFLVGPTGVGSQSVDTLDQTNGDSYGGVQSIVGSGQFNINGHVDTYNTNWFSGVGGSTIVFALSDGGTKLPFTQVDPSACFFATSISGPLTNPTCTGGPFVQNGVSSVGAINGVSGPNTMIQTDANTSFLTQASAVPEPATMTLLGIGLLGSAAARRRQKNAKK